MTTKISFFLVICLLLAGCAGSTMRIRNSSEADLRPMGLFVCSSTQIRDDRDLIHRKFVIDLSVDTLSKLLNKKYEIIPLNDKIPYEEVFQKNWGRFNIDEKKIAQIAKQEGCRSCLIVYYALAELHVVVLTPSGIEIPIIDEKPLKSYDDMTLHLRSSLYGWLVSADNAKLLAESHSILSPFDKYIQDRRDKAKLFQDYLAYMTGITRDMFLPMVQ